LFDERGKVDREIKEISRRKNFPLTSLLILKDKKRRTFKNGKDLL